MSNWSVLKFSKIAWLKLLYKHELCRENMPRIKSCKLNSQEPNTKLYFRLQLLIESLCSFDYFLTKIQMDVELYKVVALLLICVLHFPLYFRNVHQKRENREC